MALKNLIKPSAVILGCAGGAIAAPFLAPYLATISLPFFGTVLAGVINNNEFTKKLGDAISTTAAGFLTEIGGHFATDKIPSALSSDHNFHLEKMLATAYLESLRAIETEIQASADDELKEQTAQIFPLIKTRIERGLKKEGTSLLFPLQAAAQPVDKAFANRFSAEKVSLLIADEEKWHEQLGDEVEITLRRWLGEERAAEERAVSHTQLGLTTAAPLPEPLRSRLRVQLPHSIAHRISELVKRDDFKESWIAFQRAHLQGILSVVESIETSQADIKQSVDALTQRIEGFANRDEFVEAIAEKLQVFLSQTSLPPDGLTQLFERQIGELRGLEARLSAKIDQSTERLSSEGKDNTEHLSEKIESLDKKVEEAILEGATRAARNRLKQLPSAPRDFTGREAELEELRQALRQRGVTISGVQGMGGVGKTALALVLAHEFKDEYPDAQIYLDLKGVSKQPVTPAEVMWHVISSFHPDMKRPDDDELPSWYADLLNRHRTLLLYDNAQDGVQIERLLPPEHCLLLVTSRRHFKLPGMFDKNLEEMTGPDGEALLIEIAPRIGKDAAAIANQCGYLPLALRLAASALNKSHALSPPDLLQRLQDKRKRVKLIEASFSLSYELLSEELQQRWRVLAIFPADFDPSAAAALWQADGEVVKYSLAELEEYSLLNWDEAARRYSLHDLARIFADMRLSDTERELAGFLHASYYQQILSTAGDLYQEGNEGIARGLSLFDSERVNAEAGQEWAVERFVHNEQAARLCSNYSDSGVYVLGLRQHPRDFIRWNEAALAAARHLKDQAAEGRHSGNLGYAYDDVGEYRRAIAFYEQQLDIAREIGDRRSEGTVLGNLGVAYTNLGETLRAIEFHERHLAITREIDDRRGEGNALGNLGLASANLGEMHRAIEFYEQQLVITREIGDRRGEGLALGNLGSAHRNLGETRRAIKFFEQSLAITREIGDRRSEGANLGNIGTAYADLGETRRAIEFYEQRLSIAREIGDPRGEGNARRNLGITYAALGEPAKAVEFMEAALTIFEEIESPTADFVRGWLDNLRGKSE